MSTTAVSIRTFPLGGSVLRTGAPFRTRHRTCGHVRRVGPRPSAAVCVGDYVVPKVSAQMREIYNLAADVPDMSAIPVPVLLGVAVAIGLAVNGGIVLALGAAGKQQGTDTSEQKKSDGRSDDFDIEGIFNLVEAAEQEDIESRIRSTPGREIYSPASFADVLNDSVNAVRAAIEDGILLLEVQLPSIPTSNTGLGEVDSNAEQRINLQLAAAFAQRIGGLGVGAAQ
eukprot:9469903-Pyramimonas_sp.AAC.1